MRVAFLYNGASEDPAQIAEDGDPSRSPLVAAIRRLGHDVTPINCTLDLDRVRRRLDALQPDVAFNRVESLGGSDAAATAVAVLLDAMGVPYTGCPTEALVATANKVRAKEQLVRAGLPTPDWIADDCEFPTSDVGLLRAKSRFETDRSSFILKAVFEHASFEMDDASVVESADLGELSEFVRERSARYGKPFFAERFVEGREFNLSLIGDPPVVLPPAEIDFSAFPAAKPRIVGFGAKWAEDSFEFQNTPRTFDIPPRDKALLTRLKGLAVECWQLFGLRGYARVDFRVDAGGQPWILEVNTNPCLAPTSGFAAAAAQAGLSYDDAIQRILEAASPQVAPDVLSSSI